jgi:hypothetical protein
MYANVISGRFTPRNPKKYMGDPTKIVYRSSWEAKVMTYFDKTDEIIAWASEELPIPYISPVDKKPHRYFPDFIVKSRTKDGKIKTMMVEVKPYKQTIEPKIRKRITKQYIAEVVTWSVNSAKWAAAEEYCKDRGWEFQKWHEGHLGISTK